MDISKCLVWIDLETTGLDPDRGVILELACVVTDAELNEVSSLTSHIGFTDERVAEMREHAHPVVQKMHDENGLWVDCSYNGPGLHELESMVLTFLRGLGVPERRIPMCGSTIGFDRGFLRSGMVRLHDYFSHRNYDVSVFREEAERRYPAIFAARPGQVAAHRALPDIRQSIESLRYYRSTMMRPPEGT